MAAGPLVAYSVFLLSVLLGAERIVVCKGRNHPVVVVGFFGDGVSVPGTRGIVVRKVYPF